MDKVGPIPVKVLEFKVYLVAMFTVTHCKIVPGVAFVNIVPPVVGSVTVPLPATAGACNMTEPLVSPRRVNELIGSPNVSQVI